MLPQKSLTPFIGRHTEIAEITRLLADPACRLLTLVGPGGIGKTRLAIEVAARVKGHFEHGDGFVSLQALSAPEFLVTTIGDALEIAWTGQADPQIQLFNFLHDKEVLLLLDNFEQLQAEAGLLAELLYAAQGVKLLVTSREILNLRQEWLFPVQGLSFPGEEIAGWANHDAVQFFAERARRVSRDFSPAEEATNIIRLCRFVEGMPLALELAASWLKSLRLTDIVTELQHKHSLDILTTSQQDVPERHRSIRLVFAHAWQRLAPSEQQVFMRLSLFHSGFGWDAAAAVTGATLPELAALVDKSLLRQDSQGRYHIHELLRQFAADRLATDPDLLAQTYNLYANYYSRFLGDRFDQLIGGTQEKTLAEIGAELGNVRAAWQWAAQEGRVADLEYAAMTLHTFYQYKSRFSEGAEALAAAVAAVEKAPPSLERDRALALILTCAGWLEMRFGHVEQATQMQERALSLYETHDLSPAPGAGTDPLTALSLLAATRGEFEEAVALGQRAWQRAAARDDAQNMAYAGYGLTSAALAQGEYEAALSEARSALAQAQVAGNRWLMAYLYNQLGQTSQALGNGVAARHYYQASYAIRELFDDPEGMALALSHLGEMALVESKYQEAHDLCQRSITLYRKLADRGGLARAFHGMGVACSKLGNEADARRVFEQALRTATAVQAVPLTLSLLVGIGEFLVENGTREPGVAALTLVMSHPAAKQADKDKVRQFLQRCDLIEPATGLHKGIADLGTIIPLLLAELTAVPPLSDILPPSSSPAEADIPAQPLLDPLSERELEVLQAIAAGLKNREIAQTLTVALSTIKTHVNNIYSKLGVSNRVQAVERARALNLLDL